MDPCCCRRGQKSTFRNGWGKFCSKVPKFDVADVGRLRISGVGSDRYANSATTSAQGTGCGAVGSDRFANSATTTAQGTGSFWCSHLTTLIRMPCHLETGGDILKGQAIFLPKRSQTKWQNLGDFLKCPKALYLKCHSLLL